MRKRHIVFLESNPTTGLEALKQTNEVLDCRITFLTSDLKFYTKGKPIEETPLKYAHRILEIPNTGSLVHLKQTVDALQKEEAIDAFMSFSEYHMVPSSEVAEYLGLSHISSQASKIARNKFTTRQTLEMMKIPQPKFIQVSSFNEAQHKIKDWGYPVIVKPVDGTASLNVRVVFNDEELKEHMERLLNQRSYGRSTEARPMILLEEFIEGDLVSVETLSKSGQHSVLGITNRALEGYPCFVEVGESFPVDLPNTKEVIHVCLNALNAIHMNFGPAHTEIILSKDGPKLVEINPRLAGGVIPKLIDLTMDRHILLDIVRLHLSEPIPLNIPTKGVASAYFFYSKETGAIRDVQMSPHIHNSKVKEYKFSKEKGDFVSAIKSNFDRLGYVIVHDKTLKSAEELCKKIMAETQLVIGRPKISTLKAESPLDLLMLGVRIPTLERYDVGIRKGVYSYIKKSSDRENGFLKLAQAKKILSFDQAQTILWPSFVESHAHLALSPTIDGIRQPTHITALQYLYYGITRVLDLFGFPFIEDEWRQAESHFDFPFPEVAHCGLALTASVENGLYGHGHEFPIAPYYIQSKEDVGKAIEDNVSKGATFIKVMFTEGREVDTDKPRFSILKRPLLEYLHQRLNDFDLPAIVDTNSYEETLIAKNIGFSNFAHLMRDRALHAKEWDQLGHSLFLSTLSALTPMVMHRELFYKAFGNPQFLAAQPQRYFEDMDKRIVSYGTQTGIQESRLIAIRYLLQNTQTGLSRSQVIPASDTGNTFSYHGYGLHREFELIQPQNRQEKEKMLRAATERAHELFVKFNRSACPVELKQGGQADFNLFEENPVESKNGFFPWKTFIRGLEVPREKIREILQKDDYFSNQQTLRKVGAL